MHHELNKDIRNLHILILAETRLELRVKMQSIVHTLVEASYEFMINLLIRTNAKIRILTRQSFLDNKSFY